jgi:hypothetical protein
MKRLHRQEQSIVDVQKPASTIVRLQGQSRTPHHVVSGESGGIMGQGRANVHYASASATAFKVREQLLDQEKMTKMVCCHGELNAILRQNAMWLHQASVAYQDIKPMSLSSSIRVPRGKLFTEVPYRSQ